MHILDAKFFLAGWLCLALSAMARAAPPKPRIIVLTDIAPVNVEPDDMESLIRLLVHADLFEIEGLVATTGWSNDGGKERPDLIKDAIDAYEKDLPNLLKRSDQKTHPPDEGQQKIGYWPSPSYLRSRTVIGSKKRGYRFIGEGNDSPGSELIIKTADENDQRPIWVLAWGGGNTLAQAIWNVKRARSAEQLQTFLNKLRFYAITDQDRAQRGEGYELSSHSWMRREFGRKLQFLWDESAWTFQNGTGKRLWNDHATHIQGHGYLGTLYPKYKYGVEGDTPSFLYVMPNGLNDPEHPNHGGWGGYFEWLESRDNKTLAYVNDSYTSARAVSQKYQKQFYPATFNNFAARMDWARDGAGNRNPVVVIDQDAVLAPIKLAPAPGSSVKLDASDSRDPDGDQLTFSWWVLTEAGTVAKKVTILGNDSSRATIEVPPDSGGGSFHLICEVTDNGTHPLTSYARIIVEPTEPAHKR